MKKTTFLTSAALLGTAVFMLFGCQAGGDFTGREYMPDMAHAISYETNLSTYYHYNQWVDDSAYHKLVMPRKIVNGTIPRGFTSFLWSGDIAALKALKEGGFNMNGHVPYYYPDSDSGRALAIAAIVKNPFAATKNAVEKGKELYNVNCAICHGEKGDGNGYLWRDGEGPYPAKPANFMEATVVASSEGRYYHAIMRGKGVMGAYADKLSFEERWDVIHYIRSMQAKAAGGEYALTEEAAAMSKKAANFDLGAAEKMLESHQAANQTLTLNDLKFKTGSAEIDIAASKDLDDLVVLLQKSPTMTIALSGHTDNAGNPKDNLKLSDNRAKAVVDYLVKKGIAANRISEKGFGDTMPIADNSTEAGKAQNRRTDVTIIKE